jgi:chemotaxis protein methyltransferase CheR
MSLSNFAFDYLAQLVRTQSSIVLDQTKSYIVESRLAPLLYDEGVGTIDELVRRLRHDRFSPLHHKVLDAMTNNETWFFRDVYPFEILKQVVLPDLKTRLANHRNLAVWSAASSSGQEIYSVAMLIREEFPSLLNWNLRLLGTDISAAILVRAQLGLYSQLEVNRGLPVRLLTKHFEQIRTQWQLCQAVREMATFQSLNLSGNWPPLGKFDVVFLRNVLIYFPLDTRKQILAKIRQVLNPAGYLFLGSAETTLNLDDSYERIPFQKAFYYRPRI